MDISLFVLRLPEAPSMQDFRDEDEHRGKLLLALLLFKLTFC